jgi:hypothetical protein
MHTISYPKGIAFHLQVQGPNLGATFDSLISLIPSIKSISKYYRLPSNTTFFLVREVYTGV